MKKAVDPPHLCDPECDLPRLLAAQMANVRQRSCDLVRYNRRGHRHRPCLDLPPKENTEPNIKIPAGYPAGISMAQETPLGFPAHALPFRCGKSPTLSTASIFLRLTVLPLSGRVPALPDRSAGSVPPASRWRSGAPADPAAGAAPAAAGCCLLLRPAPIPSGLPW